jgi:Tripartite tricarboxylate transporter TctB family
VVYVLALPTAGYLVATPLFLGVVLWLLAIRSWMLVAVPLGFTVPVFLVFSLFLNVRLPTGILDGVLRQLGLV